MLSPTEVSREAGQNRMRTLSTEDFASAGHGELMTVSVTFPSAAEMLDTFVLTLALGTNFRVSLGGITRHPHSSWMEQVARNATMQDTGYLNGCRYLLHDRDKKFCRGFRETLAAGGVKCTPIPARSPNLNAHAERWVRSIKEECLSKLILFAENSLRRVVSDFVEHYHQERNHQGKDNLLTLSCFCSRYAGSAGRDPPST